MRRREALIALTGCLVLGACAVLPQSESPQVPLGPALPAFVISGRLALRQDDRSDHAGFEWRHSSDADEIVLTSPLGQDLARIGRDTTGAWLSRGGEERVVADTLDALAAKLFGAPLPFSVLAAWISGDRGWVGLVDGWRVTITEAVPYHQRRLPRRIELRRDDVELVLLIREWSEML